MVFKLYVDRKDTSLVFYVSKRYNWAEENLLLLKGYKCDTLPVHPGPSSDDH